MTARIWYKNSAGTDIEITDHVPTEKWTAGDSAETGTVGSWTIPIDDPDLAYDITGHRQIWIVDSDSEVYDDVLWWGFTGAQAVQRGGFPLERTWLVTVYDTNTYWNRRVMTQASCKRPKETDVHRIDWALATSEALWVGNTTFVYGGGPVSMDAVDYRGQYLGAILDDCAQHTGKNWYTWMEKIDGVYQNYVWYGKDTLGGRTSTLTLSNDKSIIDSSSVFAISADTKITRDPSRVYSGVYLPYDGGAVYRTRAATAAAFAKRDFIAPSISVKSKTAAIARATRYLNDMKSEHLTYTTTVDVPTAKHALLRPGQRVKFQADHLPEASTMRYARIIDRQITQKGAGERYSVMVNMVDGGPAPYTGSAFAALLDAGISSPGPDFHYTGDTPPVGWYSEPGVGPLDIAQSGYPFFSISAPTYPITVRAEVLLPFSTTIGAASATVQIGIYHSDGSYDSVVSGTLTHAAPVGVWSGSFHLDQSGVALEAGDVITVILIGDNPGFLTGAVNGSYFRVGKGTFVWNSGAVTWVGA